MTGYQRPTSKSYGIIGTLMSTSRSLGRARLTKPLLGVACSTVMGLVPLRAQGKGW